MTVIRMPIRRIESQVNGNRDWAVGLVSPQDGTPTRLHVEEREFRDDHGNAIPYESMAGNRPWQIFRRWFRITFLGAKVPPAPRRKTDTLNRNQALKDWKRPER